MRLDVREYVRKQWRKLQHPQNFLRKQFQVFISCLTVGRQDFIEPDSHLLVRLCDKFRARNLFYKILDGIEVIKEMSKDQHLDIDDMAYKENLFREPDNQRKVRLINELCRNHPLLDEFVETY